LSQGRGFNSRRLHHLQTNNPPLAGYLFSGGDPEFVVPAVGIELTTYRLQGGCSTN
jgi:hypothetical protein